MRYYQDKCGNVSADRGLGQRSFDDVILSDLSPWELQYGPRLPPEPGCVPSCQRACGNVSVGGFKIDLSPQQYSDCVEFCKKGTCPQPLKSLQPAVMEARELTRNPSTISQTYLGFTGASPEEIPLPPPSLCAGGFSSGAARAGYICTTTDGGKSYMCCPTATSQAASSKVRNQTARPLLTETTETVRRPMAQSMMGLGNWVQPKRWSR